ncbi:MAG: alpha-L-fucosidase, partial [Ilumatobacteraceae bacterium]
QDMGELFAAGDWAAVFRWSPYTEWYLNSMSLEGSPTAEHHAATYGDRPYSSFVEEFRDRSLGAEVAGWAGLFAAAGALYVVPVTKHHDGFLMWQSAISNPHRQGWMASRDHIAELEAAVRQHGMRFGLYYSGGLDWTFNPPPIDGLAAMFANIPTSPEYCEYATAQMRELIDRFHPGVLWNDIGWPKPLDPNEMFEYFYDRVPDGVVNDRFDMLRAGQGLVHSDIRTPEYSTTAPSSGKWEVCRGIGRSFGYNRMERGDTLPSADELVWLLADIVGRGGNLLLNVGPTADGQIPLAQAMRLTAVGWWLRVNGAAIYGTRPWTPPIVATTGATDDGREVRFTTDGTTVYAIIRGAPHSEVRLPGVRPGEGAEVRMLGNSRVLAHSVRGDQLVVDLPDHLPDAPATVLAIGGC